MVYVSVKEWHLTVALLGLVIMGLWGLTVPIILPSLCLSAALAGYSFNRASADVKNICFVLEECKNDDNVYVEIGASEDTGPIAVLMSYERFSREANLGEWPDGGGDE